MFSRCQCTDCGYRRNGQFPSGNRQQDGQVSCWVGADQWTGVGVGVAVGLNGRLGGEGPVVAGDEGAGAGLVPAGVHVDLTGIGVCVLALVAEGALGADAS